MYSLYVSMHQRILPTCVLGETNGQWALTDLLFEQIFFVQEQNDWCVREPFIIANWVEQFEWLLHSILYRWGKFGERRRTTNPYHVLRITFKCHCEVIGQFLIQTVVSSSCKTWSYSDIATQNMIAVTSSKQWIHFFRSDRWPPTSNNLMDIGKCVKWKYSPRNIKAQKILRQYSLKVKVLKGKVYFNYAGSFHSCS